ncbi:DUF6988 family protein [Edaphobacter modestus]|uniref:Uncharacterized protein n=1 Tax=Edaphobacter modestus TaxID=388466 RepID=A0A4Q7YS24_9BACT|nr:hypothetical protein [Edaphobacter modestus]RZU40330.1 hypothetical protein BDD14_1777 [Edaphobacter modestus]
MPIDREELGKTIEDGIEFRASIWELLQEVESNDKRSNAVLRFVSVALQHHHSILVLMKYGSNDSSALALLRPLKDTCERGTWVASLASDEQIEHLLRGELDFQSINAGKHLEEKHGVGLSKDIRKILHGLTHTGNEQLSNQFSERGQFESAFDIPVLVGAIRSATVGLMMLTVNACVAAKREDVALRAFSLFTGIFGDIGVL